MATSVSGDALALEENAAHIALSMEPIPGNEICEAAESCQEFFSACASSPAHEKHIASIRSAQGDFNLWCSAIKAASRGKASLDYRLRNHPDTRDAVCDLLASLKASLAKYAQSAVRKCNQDVACRLGQYNHSNACQIVGVKMRLRVRPQLRILCPARGALRRGMPSLKSTVSQTLQETMMMGYQTRLRFWLSIFPTSGPP